MCEVLNVSSSCYYRWLVSPESPRERRSRALVDRIQMVHRDSRYIYGSPRITAELQKKVKRYQEAMLQD